MNDQKQQGTDRNSSTPADATSKGHGQQGIDKAPGEEPNKDNVQFQQETQKGKKVDGDPTEESGTPADQDLGKEF